MTKKIKQLEKKFLREFGIAMVAFLIIMGARTLVLELYELSLGVKVLVILSPVAPLFFALWAYVKKYRAMDEFMQRMTGEAFLWTIGIVSFLCFGHGLLAFELDIPSISLAWVMPVVFGGHGLVSTILLKGANNEE